jgi:hypothetical protein
MYTDDRRTLVAVAERFLGVGCSLISSLLGPSNFPTKFVVSTPEPVFLKVHKIENFFDSDFGICVISLIVMSKY